MACAVQGCKSHSNKCRKRSSGDIRGDNDEVPFSFHRFPENLALKRKWLKALKQDGMQKHRRICCKHFTPESFEIKKKSKLRRLKADAVPTLLLTSDQDLPLDHEEQESLTIEIEIAGDNWGDPEPEPQTESTEQPTLEDSGAVTYEELKNISIEMGIPEETWTTPEQQTGSTDEPRLENTCAMPTIEELRNISREMEIEEEDTWANSELSDEPRLERACALALPTIEDYENISIDMDIARDIWSSPGLQAENTDEPITDENGEQPTTEVRKLKIELEHVKAALENTRQKLYKVSVVANQRLRKMNALKQLIRRLRGTVKDIAFDTVGATIVPVIPENGQIVQNGDKKGS